MKLKKVGIFFLLIILASTLYLSTILNLKSSKLTFCNFLTYKFNHQNMSNYKIDFVSLYINSLTKNHFQTKTPLKDKNTNLVSNPVAYSNDNPLIYIYSTHTNEEYSYQKNDLYNIVPTVKTASYILEEELKKLGLNSLVEKENTIDILNQQGLNYSKSYQISRNFLEKRKSENPSLTYFLDIHRDSVKNTTIEINGVKYAKILFLLGLENENYLENKEVIIKLNDYLNTNYKGLSKGIYEKKGPGVDGVYNQDFSKNVLLIEVGGIENTIEEVSNSLKVIASSLYNYINTLKRQE